MFVWPTHRRDKHQEPLAAEDRVVRHHHNVNRSKLYLLEWDHPATDVHDDCQQRAHVRGPLSTSAVCCRQATGAATGRTQFRKTFSEQTLMAPGMNSIRQRRPEVRELPPNRRTHCAVLGRRDNVTVASTSATPGRGHCPAYPAVFPPRGSLPQTFVFHPLLTLCSCFLPLSATRRRHSRCIRVHRSWRRSTDKNQLTLRIFYICF